MRKIIFIAIGIVILATIGWLLINKNEKAGGPVMPESYILSNQVANEASVSDDVELDQILYSGDLTATLSVGEYVTFDANVGAIPSFLSGEIYCITSASDEAFQVGKVCGGAEIDITASMTGGEYFTEVFEGKAFPALQGRTFVYSVAGDDTASTGVKFVCSIQNNEPDFLATKSIENQWDYCDVYDLQNANSIDGDTGIELAGAGVDVRLFQVFGDGWKWLSAIVAPFETGTIDVELQITN